ncbi:hypothetical protein BDN72DRAFT_849590 [Pluteus cervinus]|uniref:Uncharacterized protein n=1 Tax=Pluteus cervinus TaxID=181527 RepID=A0ACD3A7Z0_9AGAR|nr:hypothetical protein BDN72DRAFT_849590 [Pluteus cervinus]
MASTTSSPDAVAAEVAALLPLLSDDGMVKYTNIAFLMLLVYDHAITFDQEVERIWVLPWRLPKFLFMINRYLVPPTLFFGGIIPSVDDLSPGVRICKFDGKWTSWPTIVALATVEIMLILRVVALYSHDKRVTIFLITAFIVQITAYITLSVMIMNGTTGSPGGDVFSGCLFSAPAYFWVAWLPPVCFESVIVVLTLYKVLQYKLQVSAVLNVYARDSLLYFLSMFSILLSNLLLARFGTGFMGALLIAPSSVVACVAVARMTMNMRQFTMKAECTTRLPGQELRPARLQAHQDATFSTIPSLSFQTTGQIGSNVDGKEDIDVLDTPVDADPFAKAQV